MSEDFGILLGKMAVARQLLSQEQARHCFQLSQRQHRSFSDTALTLGYLNTPQIQFLIGQIQQQQTLLDRPLPPPPPIPPSQLQTTVLSPPSTFAPGSGSDAQTMRLAPGSASFPPAEPSPKPRSKTTGLSPGDVFDGYKILSLLGQGGMGAVYKVEKQGKTLALKVITSENMKAEARFAREAGAAMSVSGHPNIVAIEGYTKFNDQPYLVMEFVEGKGLDEFISPNKPYDPVKTVELATKIASALAFVHKKGITHRDLKPANILIRDSDGEPLITDFGLAKLVDYETMTRTADWLGTPAYMSPEQAGMDHKEVDSTSDTWALGVILYELSTGRRPFQADEIYQLINMILEKNPEPPSTYNAHIDPNLEIIILKTLNKDKANRYSDADQLARDIAKIGSQDVVEAYVEGSIDELSRNVKKKVGRRSLRLAWIALLWVIPALLFYAYWELSAIDNSGESFEVASAMNDYGRAIEKVDESAIFEQCARGLAEYGLFPEPEDVFGLHREDISELRRKLQETLAKRQDPNEVLQRLKKTRALAKLDRRFEFYQSLMDPERKVRDGIEFTLNQQNLIAALNAFGNGKWKEANLQFRKVENRESRKDSLESSLALFGAAMCWIQLGHLEEANTRLDALSTRKYLGSLGEEFFLFYLGDKAMTSLLNRDEKAGKQSLGQFSKRLQSSSREKRKRQWAAWNRRFKKRYYQKKNLQLRLSLRLKQWNILERMDEKFPNLKLFKLDFELNKALGEDYGKRYGNAVLLKSPNRLDLQRKAIFYHLNAFLHDKTYIAPAGYHAPQLADFISTQSLPSKTPKERELAFQVLLDASRLGVYIPTFQAALSQFIKQGLFEKALESAPNDPYLHFWRGSGAVPYYSSLWNEKKLKKGALLNIIDRSAADLDLVFGDPELPSYFRALAADRWVATRRFKQDIAKGHDPTINTEEWRRRLKMAIAFNTHPKPENLLQSLFHLSDSEDMEVKLGLVKQRMDAIKDRRARSASSDLARYRGRPVGCPMDALNQSEFLRLEASTNRLYAQCYMELRDYRKAILAAKQSFDYELSQGTQDIEESSVRYLLKAYLELAKVKSPDAQDMLNHFDQLYAQMKLIEKRYDAQGNTKLAWISELKGFKEKRDKLTK